MSARRNGRGWHRTGTSWRLVLCSRKRSAATRRITLDIEADKVSAELARHGIAAGTRVHVLVAVADPDVDALFMTAFAQAGGGLDWLADEPDLHTDADLVPKTH